MGIHKFHQGPEGNAAREETAEKGRILTNLDGDEPAAGAIRPPLTRAEIANHLAILARGSTPRSLTAEERAAANRQVMVNLGVAVPDAPLAAADSHLPPLTRREIADYLDRAGFDEVKAAELAVSEHAVDFGYGLTSKQLDGLACLIKSALEAERAVLQLHIVDLLARWLLRKGQAVSPDGRIVVGIGTLAEARKVVAGWLSDELARRKNMELGTTEPNGHLQQPKGQSRQVPASPQAGLAATLKARSGRPPRLSSDFVDFAAELWTNNKCRTPGSPSESMTRSKATYEGLGTIALSLDSMGFIPPSKYLEKHFADELRSYNSRNSNSKTGAIKTWSQLVSVADKDHLRGMRRLLSRCAENSSSHRRVPSGN
jgi:hypothetical protein